MAPFASLVSLLPQATVDALLLGMVYALVAVGLALIWGVADIVNFAYGAYLTFAMLVTAFISATFGVDPLLLLPFNTVLMFGAGYATHVFVTAKVMDSSMESQIYVTFGLFVFLQFAMLVVAGPETVSVEEFALSGTRQIGGIFVSIPKLATAITSVLTIVALFVLLKRTKTGKGIRATAQDEEVARVMGIDTHRMYAITWGLGTATLGVAGTLLVTFVPAQPEVTPLNWTLVAFTAVALGGFGNVLAAALGGLVIAFVEQFGVRLLDPSFKQIYIFSVFLAALLIRQVVSTE